jgi:ribosome maturation factor RimP
MKNMSIEGRQHILELARQVAGDHGVELFDLELLGKGKMLLRVIIDRTEGVTLDHCEKFSKSLSAVLDVENPIPGPYTLEVSSPGLDRPLRSLEDFEKYRGRCARIVTMDKIENRNFLSGRIEGVEDGLITLFVDDHSVIVPFDKISKARLEIELPCPKNSVTS